MGAGGVGGFAGEGVFLVDADADFHGGTADVVDAGLEDDVVADVDGLLEDKRVDAGGDGLFAAVLLGGHGGDDVYPADDGATEGGAVLVGVVGHYDVAGLDDAVGGAFRGLFFCVFFGHFSILNLNGLKCSNDCKVFKNRCKIETFMTCPSCLCWLSWFRIVYLTKRLILNRYYDYDFYLMHRTI